MPNSNPATIELKFDGLLLFCLDEQQGRCEAKICTVADNHELSFQVFKSGGERTYGPFKLDAIKNLHPISVLVESGSSAPVPPLVKDETFDLLLNLAGEDFYGAEAQIKSDRYESSFFIHS